MIGREDVLLKPTGLVVVVTVIVGVLAVVIVGRCGCAHSLVFEVPDASRLKNEKRSLF